MIISIQPWLSGVTTRKRMSYFTRPSAVLVSSVGKPRIVLGEGAVSSLCMPTFHDQRLSLNVLMGNLVHGTVHEFLDTALQNHSQYDFMSQQLSMWEATEPRPESAARGRQTPKGAQSCGTVAFCCRHHKRRHIQTVLCFAPDEFPFSFFSSFLRHFPATEEE